MSFAHSQLGHYQLLHHIGDEATETVYLANDIRAPRQVAVKILRTDDTLQANNSEIIGRIEEHFKQTMQAITRLNHPHILPVLDFGTEKIDETSYAYMVMPYHPAGTLASWLAHTSNDPCLPLSTVASVLSQAAEALYYAHERDILHQDIKPTNILLPTDFLQPGTSPDILLADFSIARLLATSSSQGLSQSPYVRSTYLFLAPEQWNGKSVPASDQYALAILAFYLLTGQYPFQGSLGQVIHQHYQTPPPAPGSLNPQLDPAIDKIIQRALAKEPEKRFPSIRDFAQAFALLQHLSDTLPRSPVPSASSAPSSRLAEQRPAQSSQTPTTPTPATSTALPAHTAADATRIAPMPMPANSVVRPAQASPDETLSAPKASTTATILPTRTSSATTLSSVEPTQTSATPMAANSVVRPAQTSPDETLSAPKSATLQADPAKALVAPAPNEATQRAELPSAAHSTAITETQDEISINAENDKSRNLPPTVLALTTAGHSEAQAPVPNGSAPPLPIFQFHEPQAQLQLPAMRRKNSSTIQKVLVIGLIVLVVLAASGTLLFKGLAAHNASTASNASRHGPQANETMQAGQALGAGGINTITVTPTSTNSQTPTTTTPGSQSGSAPGSQPGSTPGSQPGSTPSSQSGSTPSSQSGSTPGGSTGPTAQPTSPPAAQPTTAPAARPTAIATPKPAPKATPTPHSCDTSSWSSTLSPTYAAGGTEHFVSPYCSGVVSIAWTSAPPSGGHEVKLQICYGQRTSNCSGWVTYTGVNVWHVVATGRSSGQGFYINNSCSACSGSSFKIYGAIKY